MSSIFFSPVTRFLPLLSALLVSIPLGPATDGDIVPEGSELQVNITNEGDQFSPTVAATPNGGFIVAWVHDRNDGGENRDVFARRYSAGGVPLSLELDLSTVSDRPSSGQPNIGVDAAGNFVLAMTHQNLCCSFRTELFYRGFNPDGISNEIGGNASQPFTRSHAVGRVAVAADGSFILSWLIYGDDGPISSWGAYSKFIDSSGTADDSNTQRDIGLAVPSVSASSAGGFFYIWSTREPDSTEAHGLWLAADGTARGPAFDLFAPALPEPVQLISQTQPGGIGLALGMQRTGDLVQIHGQRIDSDGLPLGDPFPVQAAPVLNPVTSFFYYDVTVLPNGEFVVVWEAQPADGTPDQFYARHFRQDGTPLTEATLLNLPSFSVEVLAQIAAISADSFVVVWTNSDDRDGSGSGIFAQRYALTRPLLFEDGFESGDLSAWSASFP